MNELKINVAEQKFEVVDLASCTKTICVTENVNNFVDKVDKFVDKSIFTK